MGRQRHGINQPTARHDLQQPEVKSLPQFLPPELPQVSIPQQGKEQLLLENGPRRRRQPDTLFQSLLN